MLALRRRIFFRFIATSTRHARKWPANVINLLRCEASLKPWNIVTEWKIYSSEMAAMGEETLYQICLQFFFPLCIRFVSMDRSPFYVEKAGNSCCNSRWMQIASHCKCCPPMLRKQTRGAGLFPLYRKGAAKFNWPVRETRSFAQRKLVLAIKTFVGALIRRKLLARRNHEETSAQGSGKSSSYFLRAPWGA